MFLFQVFAEPKRERLIKITGPGYQGTVSEKAATLENFQKRIEEAFKGKNIALTQTRVESLLTQTACLLKKEEFDKLYESVEKQKQRRFPLLAKEHYERVKETYKVEFV